MRLRPSRRLIDHLSLTVSSVDNQLVAKNPLQALYGNGMAPKEAVWPLVSGEKSVPDYDFRTPRLFVDQALSAEASLPLEREPSHYLLNVLRLKADDVVLIFNGKDGEFLARITETSKKGAKLSLIRQTRPQTPAGRIELLFAPLKQARLDYLVQKAVEMGVARIAPVITQHTQVTRLNPDRLFANMIEAAEQCGIIAVPELLPERKLEAVLDTWEPGRTLIFCDERAEINNPLAALQKPLLGPVSLLIGPEGGFSTDERQKISKIQSVIPISLGPRILRADTAVVAALALVQATLGDFGRS
jgi:16S rRNA (uracil1498-N3)-methyltransferase